MYSPARFTLLLAALAAPALAAPFSYTAYRFEPQEAWRIIPASDSVSIAPPDRSLLGNVERLKVTWKPGANRQPLHLYLRTHFMIFHKVIAPQDGMEWTIAAPPGNGWQWNSGENDGKIHGPLRIGEIRLEGIRDLDSIPFTEIVVEGNTPEDKRVLLSAQSDMDPSRIRFRTELRSLAPEPTNGKLQWTFHNWAGEEIGRGERQVTIPARAVALREEIAAPPVRGEVKFMEARIQLAIPGQEIPLVTPCWVLPPVPQTDAAQRPESPFGMGVYLGRYLPGEEMDRVAQAARGAGVKWSREGISWRRVEIEQGKFDWSFYDKVFETARSNGISIYALASGWAPWSKPYTPEAVDDFVVFLREAVRRYKTTIHHWEIWNEPNIFFWDGPKELYTALLIKAYRAVKEEDPQAQVLGLSTAGIDYNFIARNLAAGAPFDALTIHPYRRVFNDQAFINDLQIVSQMIRWPEGKLRPVWITEMGWAVHTPHNTASQDFAPNPQRSQAELLARTYLSSLVSGVEPNTSWYDFRDDGEDPFYFEHNMGVMYRDFRPKPAFAAYATMTSVLKGKRLGARISVPDGTFAYWFEPGVAVLWNPAQDVQVEIPARGAEPAELINTIGESSRLTPIAGRIEVQLKKGAPVYLRFR